MTDEEWELVAAAEKWEAIDRERVDAARKRQRAAWKKMFGDDSDLTDDLLSAGDGEPEEDTSESACWDRLMDEAKHERFLRQEQDFKETDAGNYIRYRRWMRNYYQGTAGDFFEEDFWGEDEPPEPIP